MADSSRNSGAGDGVAINCCTSLASVSELKSIVSHHTQLTNLTSSGDDQAMAATSPCAETSKSQPSSNDRQPDPDIFNDDEESDNSPDILSMRM
ncbi:hypothetical protein THAOC_35410 [Thalassiosira oceanica]|uniref:Uncharacterized protein n=1 Tax=Thalassiosira oceanica TaxID=159749 RepID=K0R3F1_THAOC|nr:hypothetical protein THAOC_35410 [Thalassiosira oceanica]|eukprot:EJK45949.1 hypothetical protein THAOC_35410 [Thalassiosira oceanica]